MHDAARLGRGHAQDVLDEGLIDELGTGIVGEAHGNNLDVETAQRRKRAGPERAHLVPFEGAAFGKDQDRGAFHAGGGGSRGWRKRRCPRVTVDEDGAGTPRRDAQHRPVREVGAAQRVTTENREQHADVERGAMVRHDQSRPAGVLAPRSRA